jgi:hypothetical protein
MNGRLWQGRGLCFRGLGAGGQVAPGQGEQQQRAGEMGLREGIQGWGYDLNPVRSLQQCYDLVPLSYYGCWGFVLVIVCLFVLFFSGAGDLTQLGRCSTPSCTPAIAIDLHTQLPLQLHSCVPEFFALYLCLISFLFFFSLCSTGV